MTRAQRLGEYVRALEAVAEAAGGLEHVSRLRGKLEVPQDVNQLLDRMATLAEAREGAPFLHGRVAAPPLALVPRRRGRRRMRRRAREALGPLRERARSHPIAGGDAL